MAIDIRIGECLLAEAEAEAEAAEEEGAEEKEEEGCLAMMVENRTADQRREARSRNRQENSSNRLMLFLISTFTSTDAAAPKNLVIPCSSEISSRSCWHWQRLRRERERENTKVLV